MLFFCGDAYRYLTSFGVVLIIAAHLTFWTSTVVGCGINHPRIGRWFTDMPPAICHAVSRPSKIRVMVTTVFWFLSVIAIGGIVITTARLGTFRAIADGSLEALRHDLSEKDLVMPISLRLFGNLGYLTALLGGYSYFQGRDIKRIYIILPIAILTLYSISSGGRGPLLIGGIMMFWFMLAKAMDSRKAVVDCVLVIIALGVFWLAISATRTDERSYGELAAEYTGASIPAMCELIGDGEALKFFDLQLNQSVWVREAKKATGIETERTVDREIVYIPFGFNVFTGLSEWLTEYGYLGTFLMLSGVGLVCGMLEGKGRSAGAMCVRAVLYVYLSYSIITDLAAFIVGWWICLFAALLILKKEKNGGRTRIGSIAKTERHRFIWSTILG